MHQRRFLWEEGRACLAVVDLLCLLALSFIILGAWCCFLRFFIYRLLKSSVVLLRLLLLLILLLLLLVLLLLVLLLLVLLLLPRLLIRGLSLCVSALL